MRNLLFLRFTLVLTLFYSCNQTPKKSLINPKEVIEFAEVLTYKNLSDSEKEKIKYGCYCYPKNWNRGVEFKKEDAYFVKTRLNNGLLAELSESRTFSKDYLISSNVHSLYGKYHNRWKFMDNYGVTICPTSKFAGHKTLSIKRIGQIDELIIGPLPERPKKMIIEILDSKYYSNITPEYDLK